MSHEIENMIPPYLIVTGQTGVEFHGLDRNTNVFVGSGSSCKIQITGSNVSSIHCMLEVGDEQTMKVQDWNTGTTIVNDNPIELEHTLNSGDQLRIEDNTIVPVLTAEHHATVVRELTGESPAAKPATESTESESPAEAKSETCDTTLPEPTSTDDFIAEVQSFSSALQVNETQPEQPANDAQTFDQPTDDAETFDSQEDLLAEPTAFVYDVDADLHEDDDELAFGIEPSAFEYDDNENVDVNTDKETLAEELQLMRSEVEQLRFELAQRDARVRELTESNRSGEEVVDTEQTERLVNRLEELLEELKSSDDRIRSMEELLRCSDQATHDEKEERRQIELWVTELEQRVTQRESESAAETDRLEQRLQEAQENQKHAELQLGKLLDQQTNSAAKGQDPSNEVVDSFQAQLESMQEKIDTLQNENEQLRRDSTAAAFANENEQVEKLRETEQRLAEIQLATSRERAEMSRQRAELQALKGELEQKLQEPRVLDQADTRIRAMREHLKELHQEEVAVKAERRERSLGGRISKLLGRVGK
jgi:myosin heavy subunit